ncbi:MAG: hypothetical protein PVI43_00090 [Candidatus Bathyarchaeota archaeon]|jgi:hypothetical protein
MAFDVSKGKRDRSKEVEGAWLHLDKETKFLVARANNPEYKAFIAKNYRENESLINSPVHTDEADKVADSAMLEATATFILKGWEGVTDAGKAVKYTPALAIKMLEEHDDIRQLIEDFSKNRSNYIDKQDKKDAEKLGE